MCQDDVCVCFKVTCVHVFQGDVLGVQVGSGG